MANFTNRAEIFERAYIEAPSNDNNDGILPQVLTSISEGELYLPELFDTVSTLAQVVEVEYFVPGCPPPVDIILRMVDLFALGQMPPVKSVIASDKVMCDECPRTKEEKRITRIYRPQEIVADTERCLLEQGIICCGPATRGGCGARCIRANMPCRGCFGPPPGVIDQGACLVGAISSIYQGSAEEEIARMVEEVVDPAGTFYRFGLADSMLRRKRLQQP